jgi:hypothetical protein
MYFLGRLCLVCGILSAGPAAGADPAVSTAAPEPAPAAQSGWTFSVTPYLWGANLSGQSAQFGLPAVDIDASFSDILDNLDFAGMAIADARNGPYIIFGDLTYTSLSSGSATPRGVLASSAEVEASTFAGLVGAGYSVLDSPPGRLDVVGGMRVWSVDTDISFSGGVLGEQSFSDSATWVDGLVGLRGDFAFTPQIYVVGWALVGAGQADLDWDVAASIGYRINERFSATLGYRALGVDYSEDGFLFDVVQQGPIMGLTIRF